MIIFICDDDSRSSRNNFSLMSPLQLIMKNSLQVKSNQEYEFAVCLSYSPRDRTFNICIYRVPSRSEVKPR